MANKEMLASAINKSGLKKGFIAEHLGISRPTLYKRIDNPDKFTGEQARMLSKLLRLTEADRRKIFFG